MFRELDTVRLLETHCFVGAGSRGTVVGIYRGGDAYEVEFPEQGVYTVPPYKLRKLRKVLDGDNELVLSLLVRERGDSETYLECYGHRSWRHVQDERVRFARLNAEIARRCA